MTGLQKTILAAAGAVWLVAVVVGGGILLRYDSRPGERGEAGPQWPRESRLALAPEGYTLVVTVHPHCPCTRATVVELNDLMLSLKGRARVYVLAVRPEGFPAGWEETDVTSSAQRIPGATVLADPQGLEGKRFGATTSGQTLLYDAKGRLLFNGGITEGRGHLGDNAGLQRIRSLVTTGKADRNDSLVFGCPLNAKVCPMEKAGEKQVGNQGGTHADRSDL